MTEKTTELALFMVGAAVILGLMFPLFNATSVPFVEVHTDTFTCAEAQEQATGFPPENTIDGAHFDYKVCDYPDASTRTLLWIYQIPSDTTDGDVTATIQYQTTGTDGVCWSVAFRPVSDGEIIDDPMTTPVTGCDSVTATGALETVQLIDIPVETHEMSAGDLVFIKLEREHADPIDTNIADARFISMKMEWD